MLRKVARYGLAIVVFLAVWAIGAAVLRTPALPDPWTVISQPALLFNKPMAGDFAVSLYRIVTAIALGNVLALPLGLVIGQTPSLDRYAAPLIFLTYPIPKIVFLPIFMVLLGLGDASKIVLIAVVIFFQILVTARDAARAVPEQSIMSLRSLGAGRAQIYRHVIFPASLPGVFTALRISVGTAIAVLFLAESFASQNGLGYAIINAWSGMNYPRMFAAILALAVLGVLLYEALELAERWACPWTR